MNRRVSSVIAGWTIGAALASFGPDARAFDSSALRLSVATSAAFPLGDAAKRWIDLVAQSDPGFPRIEAHPGSTLAGRDPSREPFALREGAADLAVGSALAWSTSVPALGVFALPWIAPDDAALARLCADGPLREALDATMAQEGVILVGIAPLGHRVLLTAFPVRQPSDLAGVELRTASMPLVLEFYAAFGARPYSAPLSAAQERFAQGELKGQEAAASTLAAARIPALGLRHLLAWNAQADAIVFAVGRPAWAKLPDERRALLVDAARRAGEATDAIGREQDARRDLARDDVTMTTLTAAGRAAFAAVAAPMAARRKAAIGESLVARAEAAVQGFAPSGNTTPAKAPPAHE